MAVAQRDASISIRVPVAVPTSAAAIRAAAHRSSSGEHSAVASLPISFACDPREGWKAPFRAHPARDHAFDAGPDAPRGHPRTRTTSSTRPAKTKQSPLRRCAMNDSSNGRLPAGVELHADVSSRPRWCDRLTVRRPIAGPARAPPRRRRPPRAGIPDRRWACAAVRRKSIAHCQSPALILR